MKKAWIGIVAIAIAVVVVIIVLNQAEQKPSELRIGVILPQTGYTAFIGESVRKGMDIALELAKQAEPDAKITLIYEDSAGDVKQAVSAYHKLTSVDKVNAIICVSSGAKALTPLADRDKLPLFCTAVSGSDIASVSPWCFRFFINADVDAKIMGEYAVGKRGFKKLAVIYINDEMGLSYKNVFAKTVEGLGSKIVAAEGFGFGVNDFKPILLKISSAKPDAIYIQAYTDSMARIPVQMKEVGLNIPILSVGTISQPEVMKQAGDSVEGVIYSTCAFNTFAPETPELKKFVDKFTSKHQAPPIFFEVFGYDTFNMIWLAAKSKGITSEDLKSGLLAVQNASMAAGNVSVQPNGEVSFPVILKQIKNGQWAPLDE